MRRAVFLFLVFFSFYLGAMYRSLPLMLMVLTELLLALCMWIVSRYLKRNLSISLPKENFAGEQGEEILCSCDMIRDGILPVSRFRVRMQMCYMQGKEVVSRTHTLHGRNYTVQRLDGSAETRVSQLQFGICPPYCGMLCLHFTKIYVYDYLALFSAKNRISKKIWIAVFPHRQPLCIAFLSDMEKESVLGQDKTIWQTGEVQDEIRQLHTYRSGDSYRHIHWNISARTDQIWVKEYEKERDFCVDVLLEMEEMQGVGQVKLDAFYRLLSAVVLGLLQKADMVKVHWYDGRQNQITGMDIWDDSQCRELLYKLYCLEQQKSGHSQETALLEAYALTCTAYFTLDLQLRWRLNKNLIYRFSEKELAREIAEKVFIL